MNYYISDLHVGHANIIRLDNRPFEDTNVMYQTIMDNWNSRVKTNDTVYILGDFIWNKESEWPIYVKPLAGKKVLIRGNHDPQNLSSTTKRLFEDVTNLKEIVDGERKVILCHYPIPFYRHDFSPMVYMLYGHVHRTKEFEYLEKMRQQILDCGSGEGTPMGNFINVGAMMPYMNYTPRTLDEIIAGDDAYRQTEEYQKDLV